LYRNTSQDREKVLQGCLKCATEQKSKCTFVRGIMGRDLIDSFVESLCVKCRYRKWLAEGLGMEMKK